MLKPNDYRIKAIAFDYGGVLAEFINETAFCQMADAAGVAVADFKQSYWRHRTEYDSGDFGLDSYWQRVLTSCNSQRNQESTIELLIQLDTMGWSRMNLGVLGWAWNLRRQGYRTMILSNMAVAYSQGLISSQLWRKNFDHIVISACVGMIKPESAIFLKAANEIGVKPGELLFIDDLPDNVAGASAVGLRSLHFSDNQTLAADLKAQYPDLPVGGLVCRNSPALSV